MVEKQGVPGDDPVVRRVKPAVTEQSAPKKRTTALKPPPRKKITPEEVQARFAASRAKREAREAERTPRDMRKLVRAVVASAMGVGIVGFSLGISTASEQHTAVVTTAENRATALTGAIEELMPAEGEDTKQELVDDLARAQQRSDDLAAAQQLFAQIAFGGNTEPGTNDGRPKQSVLAAIEHRRTLAEYFAPESLVLTDDEAYTFRTEDLLGPGRIDPRQDWFTRYEPLTEEDTAEAAEDTDGETATGAVQGVMDPTGYAWRTASVTLSGTPDVMVVLWTNTDTETGELLAWATARYSVESNTFRSLVVNTTTRGDVFQLKVGSSDSGSESEADTAAEGVA